MIPAALALLLAVAASAAAAGPGDVHLIDAAPVLVRAPDAGARALLAQTLPDPKRTLTSPSTCADWPEPRIYMEGQAWFTRPGKDVAVDSSHLHVGACLPHRQQLKGDVTFHVLIQKHDLPNNTTESAGVSMSIELNTQVDARTSTKYTVTSSAFSKTNWTCNAEKNLCKAVGVVTVRTLGATVFVPDGPTSITMKASLTLDDGRSNRGFEARITSSAVTNNKGAQPFPMPAKVLGIGQLANTGFPWGYTHAPVVSDIPVGAVSGTWRFTTSNFVAGSAAITSNVTGVFMSLDPNFHVPNLSDFQGKTILVNVSDTTLSPSTCPVNKKAHIDCAFKDVAVDTTQLADGPHKLFVRTDSFVDPNASFMLAAQRKSMARRARAGVAVNLGPNGGTFSAVTLMVFRVCNNASGCPTDSIAPPDENPDPPPVIAPMNPPPGAAWYNGTIAPPPQSAAAERPYDCSGWLGQRFYLEGQTWHTQPGLDPNTGSTQLHVGACLPHRQMVAGDIPLDILLQKQNFPRMANASVSMKVAFFWKGGNVTFELAQTGSQKNWACANGAIGCKAVYRTTIATRPPGLQWMIPDGLNVVEITASLGWWDGVASRSIMTRLTSHVVVANTNATDISNRTLPPSVLTRTNYPWRDQSVALASDLPLAPVAGPLTLKANLGQSGRTGANVTGILAAVDPALLLRPAPYFGTVLANGSTSFNASADPQLPLPPYMTASPSVRCTKGGGDPGSQACTLTFAPASAERNCAFNPCAGGLCDGQHRLLMRTDSYVSPNNTMFSSLPPAGMVGAGTLSTVLVVPFNSLNSISQDQTCSTQPSGGAPASTASAAADGAGDGGAPAEGLAPRVAAAAAAGLRSGPAGAPGVSAANAAARAESVAQGGSRARMVRAPAELVPDAAAGGADGEDDAARAVLYE